MRFLSTLTLLLVHALVACADEGLVHRWQFDGDHMQGKTVKALAGSLDGAVIGPVRFAADKPAAILLDGDSKNRHRIELTTDLAQVGLPGQRLSVEAWVRIDKPLPSGGIVGVFVDGKDRKGWVLGFNQSQFSFGLASKDAKKLVHVKSRTTYLPGYWYHVVGTYDGREQRIYVDGKLQGQSRENSGDILYPEKGDYLIGASRTNGEILSTTGQLEQISVFGISLSAEEVKARFNARKSRFPDMDVLEPDVADWPTHLRDNRRTGIAPDNLKFPLKLLWVYKARHAPQPSWPEEAKNDYWHKKYNLDDRVIFDCAFDVVSVGDRVYFGSSADGKVYCLDAKTGREHWTFFTEAPVRLAPTVAGDRVFVGSDDGFVYCLSARDGALQWKQPIGPSPRRIPGNGRIISAWPIRTDVLMDGTNGHVTAGVFPSQGVYQAVLEPSNGQIREKQTLSVTAQGYLARLGGKLLVATGRNPAGAFSARLKAAGKEVGKEVSDLPADFPFAFIGAGDVRLGGGNGKLAAFHLEDGKKVWSTSVEGKVYSLAVSRGRLFASTDKGYIYCFTADADSATVIEPPAPMAIAYADAMTKERYASTADWIIRQAGGTKGYCLVLGSADGRLVHEIARRSNLQVIGREPDADRAAASRRALDAAGLSHRVSIHTGSLDALPYTDCLFNVVVSDSLAATGKVTGSHDEALRVLRPHGGVAVFGMTERDIVRRPALEGEGEWTHMYADAGNTSCSGDRRVAGEFLLQWFGQPGPRPMIDRHHRTVAPLYKTARLFIPGEDRVIAVDAYNGTILWDLEIPNSRRVVVFRDCSYLALTDEHLYAAVADRCLALNPQTGRQEQVFPVPPGPKGEKREWGYVAATRELLIASAVKPGSSRRSQSFQIDSTETYYDFVPVVCSELLFGLNRKDGEKRWAYEPKSGLIINPTIALGAGAVYFIESTNAQTLKKPTSRANLKELLGSGSSLVALDATTGKLLWSKPGPFEAMQHNVFLAYAEGKLVVVGTRNSGTDKKTATVFYDVHVFDAQSGARNWFKTQDTTFKIGGDHGEQEQHPVVVGNKLYCEPYAYNLHTGEPLDWKWPWVGKKRSGCGTLSASASTFFFRNDTCVQFDLASNKLKTVTTETRPGCWINLIPAGGLLLAPEASSGCTCNFSVQTSLALISVSLKEKQGNK
ncbi:hypothetical protein AYO44_05970 [Planctomycetaceae bacterium SCGC AG-212-F19]|nr:hypothetical protein AYO44_05970 [Planctomycetaceae bacterium SCGC AG-212-F19]